MMSRRPPHDARQPPRVWLWDACAERETPSLALPAPLRRDGCRGVWRRRSTIAPASVDEAGDDGDGSECSDADSGADGALELLLHFARGGGTAVLAKLAAACDGAHVVRDTQARDANALARAAAGSGAPRAGRGASHAPFRGVLRRAADARAGAPDAAAAAAALRGGADERAAASVRLMAARAAKGCSRVHDAAVRTCVERADAKRALRRTERAAIAAVSEIRVISAVVIERGRRERSATGDTTDDDARRRVRRAEKSAVARVLEALALALGLLHLSVLDTAQGRAASEIGMRHSASSRFTRRSRSRHSWTPFW